MGFSQSSFLKKDDNVSTMYFVYDPNNHSFNTATIIGEGIGSIKILVTSVDTTIGEYDYDVGETSGLFDITIGNFTNLSTTKQIIEISVEAVNFTPYTVQFEL